MMSDKLRAAAKAALEELIASESNAWNVINNLEAALAEPTVQESLTVAEPVAWMVYTMDGRSFYLTDNQTDIKSGQQAFPLYAYPQRREWVGLTDADFEKEKFMDYNFIAGASFAEAKLREKNLQKREWVGLTDEEIWQEWSSPKDSAIDFARAIEAKLREKNT